MQMMKNEKGVTLIALVITIIVLIIIAAISLNAGLENIPQVDNSIYESEIIMVQKAVTERYVYAKTVGETERKISGESLQPTSYRGTVITDTSTIDKELIKDLKETANSDRSSWYGGGTEDIDSHFNLNLNNSYVNTNGMTYDNCYYRLSIEDLEELGITGSKNTYIVNYRTGEIYNESRQILQYNTTDIRLMTETLEAKILYLPPIIPIEVEPETDSGFSGDIFENNTLIP